MKVKVSRFLGWLVFIFVLLVNFVRAESSNLEVKVKLFNLNSRVKISGEELQLSYLKLVPLKLDDECEVVPKGNSVEIEGKNFKVPLVFEAKGRIEVDGRGYRGRLLVLKDGEGLILVNVLNLEEYLAGVINNEISPGWHIEAVKAQTVLARTYAVKKMRERKEKLYHLESTVSDQVYSGMANETERVWDAIQATRGEVLMYRGELALVFYHSCCGGFTEDSAYVWGKTKPYLRGVSCDYCKESPVYFWRYPLSGSIKGDELAKELGYKNDSVSRIGILELTPSQRVSKLEIEFQKGQKLTLSGSEFRAKIGTRDIKSTLFKVVSTKDGFSFIGSGYGHGVGLCQWGAKIMAEKGYSYRDILFHYFPGTELRLLK